MSNLFDLLQSGRVFQFSFDFHGLLKIKSQLFCRMSLNFGLPDVFFLLFSGYVSLEEISQKSLKPSAQLWFSTLLILLALLTQLRWYLLGFCSLLFLGTSEEVTILYKVSILHRPFFLFIYLFVLEWIQGSYFIVCLIIYYYCVFLLKLS